MCCFDHMGQHENSLLMVSPVILSRQIGSSRLATAAPAEGPGGKRPAPAATAAGDAMKAV
jgi:hypothetical protein